MIVTDSSLLSFRATEDSLVSAVPTVLVAQLEPVVPLALLVTMDLRYGEKNERKTKKLG